MRDITHFIDGAAVAGASGRFSEVFNPNTGEVQARTPLASVAVAKPSQRRPKAPAHLTAEAAEWWGDAMLAFELEPHDVMLLTAAAECWDRLQEARRYIWLHIGADCNHRRD